MSDGAKPIKDILNFSISTWVNFILGFLSTFILTRVFLPDVLGVVTLFSSSAIALLGIFGFGLDGSLIRFYNEPPHNEKISNFNFKLLTISVLLTFLVVSFAGILSGPKIIKFLIGRSELFFYICLSMCVIDQIILRFLNINYRMTMNIRQFNIQAIVINVVTKLSVIIGAVINSESVFYAILSNTICVTLVSLYYLLKQRVIWQPDGSIFDMAGYSPLLKFAFFSMSSMMLAQMFSLSSQLVINNMLGLYEVGIYASAGLFVAVLTAVKGGFCTYWSAFMYKNYMDDQKQSFIFDIHDIVMYLSVVFCALLFSTRNIFYLFIGEEFRSSIDFFSLIIFFPLLQTIQETTGYGINIKKKNYIYTMIMFISLFINVGLSILLIKQYTLLGVAWANFIAAVVSFCLTSVIAQYYYRSISKPIKTICSTLLLLSTAVFTTVIKNDCLLFCILVAIVFMDSLIYRKILKKLYIIIINRINQL